MEETDIPSLRYISESGRRASPLRRLGMQCQSCTGSSGEAQSESHYPSLCAGRDVQKARRRQESIQAGEARTVPHLFTHGPETLRRCADHAMV